MVRAWTGFAASSIFFMGILLFRGMRVVLISCGFRFLSFRPPLMGITLPGSSQAAKSRDSGTGRGCGAAGRAAHIARKANWTRVVAPVFPRMRRR